MLPVYPPRLSDSARDQLESLGVEVRVDSLVSEMDGSGVLLADGTRIEAGTASAPACWC